MRRIKQNLSRRDFISKTTAGLTAFGVTGKLINTEYPEKKKSVLKNPNKKIIYRYLGKTGIKLPVVNMGVMNADNPELVKRAYELGIKHFDTAWYYQRGNNEKMVGNVIKEMDVRDDVIIATKVLLSAGGRGVTSINKYNQIVKSESTESADKKIKDSFRKMFLESLERLQMDYVDIIYVHNISDPELIDIKPVKEILNEFKDQRKTKFVGVSTHKNEVEVLNKMIDMKFHDVALVANSFKYPRREEIKKVMKKAYDSGIGVIVMKTQGVVSWHYSDSKKHHTAALKWALQDDYVTTAIPGFTTFDQLDEDFSVASDLEFNSEEESFLKNYYENRTGGLIQCFQCGKCEPTCPKKADVPDLMRTYMYAAGYNNFEHSRLTYEQIPENKNLANCMDCKNCTAKCVNGINIPHNIRQLKVIFNYT